MPKDRRLEGRQGREWEDAILSGYTGARMIVVGKLLRHYHRGKPWSFAAPEEIAAAAKVSRAMAYRALRELVDAGVIWWFNHWGRKWIIFRGHPDALACLAEFGLTPDTVPSSPPRGRSGGRKSHAKPSHIDDHLSTLETSLSTLETSLSTGETIDGLCDEANLLRLKDLRGRLDALMSALKRRIESPSSTTSIGEYEGPARAADRDASRRRRGAGDLDREDPLTRDGDGVDAQETPLSGPSRRSDPQPHARDGDGGEPRLEEGPCSPRPGGGGVEVDEDAGPSEATPLRARGGPRRRDREPSLSYPARTPGKRPSRRGPHPRPAVEADLGRGGRRGRGGGGLELGGASTNADGEESRKQHRDSGPSRRSDPQAAAPVAGDPGHDREEGGCPPRGGVAGGRVDSREVRAPESPVAGRVEPRAEPNIGGVEANGGAAGGGRGGFDSHGEGAGPRIRPALLAATARRPGEPDLVGTEDERKLVKYVRRWQEEGTPVPVERLRNVEHFAEALTSLRADGVLEIVKGRVRVRPRDHWSPRRLAETA